MEDHICIKSPSETMKKVKMAGTSEKIPTGYLPNTSSERHLYAAFFCLQLFAIVREHVMKKPHNILPQN
jgi:hypothetical protein